MAPVEVLIDNPEGETLYVPPLYAPVPVKVTVCAEETDVQNGVPA